MINTVLFDLDGTLVDSNKIILDSFRYTLTKHVPELTLTEETLFSFVGPSLIQSFGKYRNKSVVMKMIDDYLQYYKDNELHTIKLYDNVIKVLQILKNNGYNIGLVTTKYKSSALMSLKHFDIYKYFDTFVFLDDVVEPKPSSEPITKALNSLNNVEEAIMIGDNTSDISAARNANIFGCGVSWALKGKEQLVNAKADYIINNMMDLLVILKIK